MMKGSDLSLRGGIPVRGTLRACCPERFQAKVQGSQVEPGIIPELRQNQELGRPSWLQLQDLEAERKELDRVGALGNSRGFPLGIQLSPSQHMHLKEEPSERITGNHQNNKIRKLVSHEWR